MVHALAFGQLKSQVANKKRIPSEKNQCTHIWIFNSSKCKVRNFQKSEIIAFGHFWRIILCVLCMTSCWRYSAIGVKLSMHDLYYDCYDAQCQNQTKINCIKSFSIFNDKRTTGVSFDSQDGVIWETPSPFAGVLTLVQLNLKNFDEKGYLLKAVFFYTHFNTAPSLRP